MSPTAIPDEDLRRILTAPIDQLTDIELHDLDQLLCLASLTRSLVECKGDGIQPSSHGEYGMLWAIADFRCYLSKTILTIPDLNKEHRDCRRSYLAWQYPELDPDLIIRQFRSYTRTEIIDFYNEKFKQWTAERRTTLENQNWR